MYFLVCSISGQEGSNLSRYNTYMYKYIHCMYLFQLQMLKKHLFFLSYVGFPAFLDIHLYIVCIHIHLHVYTCTSTFLLRVLDAMKLADTYPSVGRSTCISFSCCMCFYNYTCTRTLYMCDHTCTCTCTVYK